jgi:hypothetical protein
VVRRHCEGAGALEEVGGEVESKAVVFAKAMPQLGTCPKTIRHEPVIGEDAGLNQGSRMKVCDPMPEADFGEIVAPGAC